MRRTGIHVLFAVLVMVAAGCTVTELESLTLDGCTDLSVGESTTLFTPRNYDPADWRLTSFHWSVVGPGDLVPAPSSPNAREKAEYTATEPGTALVTHEVVWATDVYLGVPAASINYKDRCVIEIRAGDATTQSTSTSQSTSTTQSTQTTQLPGTRFEVTSTVIESNIEGVFPIGLEETAIWRFVFACDDGRCDGEVIDGGPWGDFDPFPITHRDELADYTFVYLRPLPDDHPCDEDRWTGQIVPTVWGPDGPEAFDLFIVKHQMCDTGDGIVEWEGSGVRG